MAAQDIIQNQISRLGQSQADRMPPELHRHFVEVDERSPEKLLSQVAEFTKYIRFYVNENKESAIDWSAYFPASDAEIRALLDTSDGSAAPHLGLMATFLRLYRFPQHAINALTGKHLDFQFQDVLRFLPRPAQPDHAHLVLELKKNAAPVAITPKQTFSAGKDVNGVELIYRPVRDVIVNHGRVADLKSVYRDASRLRFAPIANSADGLGSALDSNRPFWPPFGRAELPEAQIGFALASPVLRMAEGTRTIHVELQLAGLDPQRHTSKNLTEAFAAHLSGAAGWIEPQSLSANPAANRLTLTLTVSSSQSAIVDYDAAIHGHAFAAHSPVLQLLFRQNGALRYQDLAGLTLNKVRIRVEVDSLTAVNLENDFGSLNAKKAFQPFGPQPVVGARFLIGCEEALSKRLNTLEVKLKWQGAPSNLLTWYEGYDQKNQLLDGVSSHVVFQDRSGQVRQAPQLLMASASTAESTLRVASSTPVSARKENRLDTQLFALSVADSSITREMGLRLARQLPILHRQRVPAPAVRSGFITVSLVEDFLHADYRREIIRNAVSQTETTGIVRTILSARTPIILNEPYTPTVQSISLSYQAESEEVDLNDATLASFSSEEVQFFHVGCFGQMREHSFLRKQFSFLPDRRVSVLPDYPAAGEFLIGVSGVASGDSVSLLLQAAEGSGDPDLPAQTLNWSVLSDNYWRPLTNLELALETSHGLRTSGLIVIALPAEATTEHSMLPTGLIWLRATIPACNASTCQLKHVACNAVEVVFADHGKDPAHLATALPAKRITKLKTPEAVIKSVTQPFAGFGGRPQETVEMLTRRAAERLRHRNRCQTAWDYERLLLEAFPEVNQVKCIPHASEKSWLAAGNVLLVVVPDLRNQNVVDQLRPRVNTETLSRMAKFAQEHCGRQTRIHVRNPRYTRVKLAFQVEFTPGSPFNFHRRQLHEALVRVLSPWAFDGSKPIQFGGRVYRSVLLKFVEELPYVDFVTDFKLLAPDSTAPDLDVSSLQAETPDAILVSDTKHTIERVPNG